MSRWSAFTPIHPDELPLIRDIDDVMSQVDADEARIRALENAERDLRTDLQTQRNESLQKINQALDKQRVINTLLSIGLLATVVSIASIPSPRPVTNRGLL